MMDLRTAELVVLNVEDDSFILNNFNSYIPSKQSNIYFRN